MSVAKSLTKEQVAQIQNWADEGDQLPEIQRKLSSEMQVKVTYMEVRFLLGDLGIELKSPEPEPEEKDEDSDGPEEPGEAAVADEGESSSGVKVTISELVRPGMAVSGRVTFANGKAGDWWVDQMGRLGMSTEDKEFRPSETDMIDFQKELQRVARKKGY